MMPCATEFLNLGYQVGTYLPVLPWLDSRASPSEFSSQVYMCWLKTRFSITHITVASGLMLSQKRSLCK